ncbi:MAG: hypothetical protein R2723_02255 [Microbacterium sp.]
MSEGTADAHRAGLASRRVCRRLMARCPHKVPTTCSEAYDALMEHGQGLFGTTDEAAG